MATPQELHQLLQALANVFGVQAPKLELYPKAEATQVGDGHVWANSEDGVIRLWVPSTRLLAHEFAHQLQDSRHCAWPVPRWWLKAHHAEAFYAALAVLEDPRLVSHYPGEEFEIELFARVFERVYRSFL